MRVENKRHTNPSPPRHPRRFQSPLRQNSLSPISSYRCASQKVQATVRANDFAWVRSQPDSVARGVKCFVLSRELRIAYLSPHSVRHGRLRSSLRIEASQRGIGKVVADDFPEAGTGFGHCLRTALAETDTVALSDTFKNHFSLFGSCGEIIARHRVPTEQSVDSKTSCFAFAEQTRRFVLRNPPSPA